MLTKTVDITRALAIDGFMHEPELVWLAEQAQTHMRIVEIGSYLGRSTRALLDHTPGIVYAVDDWKGPRDVYIDKKDRNTIYKRFIDNVQDRRDHLFIVTQNHENLNLDVVPDMVFIDGNHEYADVKRDIQTWRYNIAPGGLLSGHDINFEEVFDAVKDTVGDMAVVPDTSIWYVRM